MKSLFKTDSLEIDDGTTITIRELAAGDHAALAELSQPEIIARVCKLCVTEWADEKEDDIKAAIPSRVMRRIAEKVFELSGIGDAKN